MMAAKKPPTELLSIVKGAAPKTFAERGQAMFVDDILALFPHKSRWWVNHSFLPVLKRKAGRSCYWWESDVLAAIDRGDI